MVLELFNYVYFIAPLSAVLIVAGLYFSLRKANEIVKTSVIGAFMLFNFIQHFIKGYIWPGYPAGFYYYNTAYNICACLIILSPIIYFSRVKWLNQCCLLVGIFAGMGALLYPMWFFGKDVLTGEFLRFAVCHGVLFITSITPLLLGQYKVEFKRFWMTGLFFLALLLIIMLNLWLSMKGGLVSSENGYLGALKSTNAFLVAGPKEGTWLYDFTKAAMPTVIFETPFVWYALPLYIGITLISFIVLMAVDFQGFKKFFNRDSRSAQ